ncbi:TetR/AcrR family transcriptional regulator [Actinoplanes lobatus]|uniref:AcrR family transcriptional regulator n=1 Tax=Actinoplanes lobatus TaxID=113568 RepID=A0A7W7HR40_9ACTN|nr:TetR/AcrR family transcriptional regulator [Actinoplanes lobatus]MBB4755156.1 AcrR family transcriptional regulator [Actinoplanes lobatus]
MTETDGGLRERKKRQTWAALREAGLRLAAERGVENVSVEEIAAAAGVSKRTLFNYFDTKEDLLFGPDPEEPERLAAIVRALPPDAPVWICMREIVLGFVATHEAKLRLHKQFRNVTPSGVLEKALTACAAARHPGEGLHARLLTGSAMTVMRSAFATWQPDQEYDRLSVLVREGFDLLGAGLVTEGPHQA